jgi:hypothetical protein
MVDGAEPSPIPMSHQPLAMINESPVAEFYSPSALAAAARTWGTRNGLVR